jgi:hypothetical protein
MDDGFFALQKMSSLVFQLGINPDKARSVIKFIALHADSQNGQITEFYDGSCRAD